MQDDACPQCAAPFNRHSQVVAAGEAGTATPKAGDLSLCIHCAAILTFGADLRLRVAAADATDGLDEPTRHALTVAQRVIRRVNGLH